MKVYNTLDMKGNPIINCPSITPAEEITEQAYQDLKNNNEVDLSTIYFITDESGLGILRICYGLKVAIESQLVVIELTADEYQDLSDRGMINDTIFYVVTDDSMDGIINDLTESTSHTWSSKRISQALQSIAAGGAVVIEDNESWQDALLGTTSYYCYIDGNTTELKLPTTTCIISVINNISGYGIATAYSLENNDQWSAYKNNNTWSEWTNSSGREGEWIEL